MIRINLLPQKRRAEPTEGSQLWLAVLMVLFLAEVAGLFVFHGFKNEELSDQKRKNAEIDSQIQQSKQAVKNHPEIKAQLERLKAREAAIENLQKARSGPTAVLLELARIMTPGRGPSVSPERLSQVRRDNPLAIYNSTWDPRRLWVTAYTESQRKLRIEGLARDGEDVSELARRMNLSDYFTTVTLLPAKQEKDQKTGLEMIKFALEAQVKY
jgi:type IV pilus assembly protein PilN